MPKEMLADKKKIFPEEPVSIYKKKKSTQQGHIALIKGGSKDIYSVSKGLLSFQINDIE